MCLTLPTALAHTSLLSYVGDSQQLALVVDDFAGPLFLNAQWQSLLLIKLLSCIISLSLDNFRLSMGF